MYPITGCSASCVQNYVENIQKKKRGNTVQVREGQNYSDKWLLRIAKGSSLKYHKGRGSSLKYPKAKEPIKLDQQMVSLLLFYVIVIFRQCVQNTRSIIRITNCSRDCLCNTMYYPLKQCFIKYINNIPNLYSALFM